MTHDIPTLEIMKHIKPSQIPSRCELFRVKEWPHLISPVHSKSEGWKNHWKGGGKYSLKYWEFQGIEGKFRGGKNADILDLKFLLNMGLNKDSEKEAWFDLPQVSDERALCRKGLKLQLKQKLLENGQESWKIKCIHIFVAEVRSCTALWSWLS